MKRYGYALLLLVPAMFIMTAAAIGAEGVPSDAVRTAFTAMTNEEGSPYDPGPIAFLPGSFTAPEATEAVVWFVDKNQSHAALAAELWLVRFKGGWKAVSMIDQSDRIGARLVDAGDKGISAVLVSASHFSTGGFITSHWSLVTLYGGKAKTIFDASGDDFAFHAMYEQVGGKDKIVTHQVSFRDNYGDSPAELIDTELSGVFTKTGVGDSGYEVVWTAVGTTTYRLVADKNGALKGVEKIR